MSKLELIGAYYEYNEYANNRLLDFASKLSEEEFSRTQGASFDSVEGNLAHIFAGQTVWLGRWPQALLGSCKYRVNDLVRICTATRT